LRLLCNNVEQYGGAEEAVEDNVADAHCMATNTHSEYLIITTFPQHLV